MPYGRSVGSSANSTPFAITYSIFSTTGASPQSRSSL